MSHLAEKNKLFWETVAGWNGRSVHADVNYRSVYIREMLQHNVDINTRAGFYNETPLVVSIQNDNLLAVQALLECGADFRLGCENGNDRGTTPLHYAAKTRHHGLEMMRLLLRSGASVSAVTDDGRSVFHMVLRAFNVQDREQRMRLLFDNVAKVDLLRLLESKYFGSTALHIAITFQYDGIIRMLLKNGASPEARMQAHGGYTALHACIRFIQDDRRCSLVLEHLLRYGADTDALTNAAYTPLHYAVEYDRPCAVAILLSAGADPHCQNKWGETPMQLATGRIRDMLIAFEAEMELLKEKCVAFAMGHHSRLGNGTSVQQLDPDVMRCILWHAAHGFRQNII
jgi:ankyrin repeat protein